METRIVLLRDSIPELIEVCETITVDIQIRYLKALLFKRSRTMEHGEIFNL